MSNRSYSAKQAENKWYPYWLEKGIFNSKPTAGKESYTIVIPPPNVTGVLHMGHMLNNTIQDVLIRRARMKGYEACWVPGTDHASIATEAKVVAMLKEKGIEKKDLSREDFLKHAWEWKEKYGGIILQQLKTLGASCDWNRTKFTMDDGLYDAVIHVFVDMYKKGLIYKGHRMVNWDPAGKTALSDEEVIYKEVKSKLFYLKYPIKDSESYLTVATTRPETIMGDVAVCVNPSDERYQHLIGKTITIPLVNREIPIIADDYVDKEFGTGCLKVTPAHDINDYEIGKRHQLPIIDVFNDDGTLSPEAKLFVGLDRFVTRKKIAKELEEAGLLEKTEEIKNNVGFSERTDAVVEPRLSSQWFVDMKKLLELHPQVLDAVMNDEIKLHPQKFKNTYRHWLENVKDWCISRQLWWGHRIPAWYGPKGELAVAPTVQEALVEFQSQGFNFTIDEITQDEDVLDTWYSSWLWPISVFDTDIFKGGKPNEDLQYYYPTKVLVTAPEILFFWVARMIMAGYMYGGEKPFTDVYLTGIVRDKQGRKMSKSLGNSPDPLELIEKYGADGVRMGMLLSSPAGNDLLFDEKYCEQGRNFWNKLWNAYRLLDGLNIEQMDQPSHSAWANVWFEARFYEALNQIEQDYDKFRISDALMGVYKLAWDDFCSIYLEIIKPEYEKPIDALTLNQAKKHFEKLLRLAHPFMPFVTEELWQEITENAFTSICISEYPLEQSYDSLILEESKLAFEIISQIRQVRNTKQIAPKKELSLFIKPNNESKFASLLPVVKKLAFLNEIHYTKETLPNSASFVLKGDEFFIPLDGLVDAESEKEKLKKELEYTLGFMKSVEAKLNNEKFVSKAKPEVVETERKKLSDAKAKADALQAMLAS